MGETLKNVVPPTDPGSMSIFDWKDPELQKWVSNAVQMQNQRVTDNNLTEFFAYEQTELDAIQLRICMLLFGLKNRETKNNNGYSQPRGTPSSLLKAYSWPERRRARELQVKISNDSDPDDKIVVNYIFVSAAFPDRENNSFIASENVAFVFNKSRKYMDAGGRVYKNWDDYLRCNHLQQGVMIYPENGTYTPTDADGQALDKVTLIAKETQSCKASAKAKEVLDKVVVFTGLVLTGTAVVTAVPLGIFAANVVAAISMKSCYIGYVCTAYSVLTGGYDKITHDESISTEVIHVFTSALSSLTGYMNKYWGEKMAQKMAKGVMNIQLWDDVAAGISQSQKTFFATLNLIKIAMSAMSVASAGFHLWTKKNRTSLDYYQFSISLFFFTNVFTTPVTLQGVFESEQGRYIADHLRSKVYKDPEQLTEDERLKNERALDSFDEAAKNAKTTQQKTYLIRNLLKIQDCEGHFSRVHQTGSLVLYTENGLVINNQITLSPEAYNQMGNEQLLQKLNDIKKYPNISDRQKLTAKLVNDYNSPDFEATAKAYVEGQLTPEQTVQFDNQMQKMAGRRKAQLFEETARFKDTPIYREKSLKMEAEIGGGKNVETWKQEKVQLDADQRAGNISQNDYDRKVAEVNKGIQKAEQARKLRKTVDEYVQMSDADQANVADAYVMSQAWGKTEDGWRTEKENINEKFNKRTNTNVDENSPYRIGEENRADKARQLLNNPRELEKVQNTYKKNMAWVEKNEQIAMRARVDINVLNEPWVQDTKNIYSLSNKYDKNERFIWHVTDDNTKTSIEQIWGVTDYREATVNRVQIFKDMGVNATNETDCIINSCGKNKVDIINDSRQFAEDPDCKMTADNAREFCQIMNAVTIVHNPKDNYETKRGKINKIYDAAEAANRELQNGQLQFSSINSLAVHAEKHRMEWGDQTTTFDYATAIASSIIQPANATGSVFTQNGGGISTNYGLQDNDRVRFGVTFTKGGETKIITVHTKTKIK